MLAELAWRFFIFSLISVGGGVAILIPQIHTDFVTQLSWMDDRAFTELIAVAQSSPGPNFLFVPLIGFRSAGWPGALVALGAFLLMPAIIATSVGRAVRHAGENPTVALVQRALRPVSAGLWLSAGIGIARTADKHPIQVAMTVVIALAANVVDINPLWWLLGASIVGILVT